jgi:hypothetical protein
MRTVKWNPFLSGVCMFLGGMLLWAGAARADITTTNAAAIVVFPKLLLDSSAGHQVDTVIQLTNTSTDPVNVRCFYVNANGHCSNDPTIVCDPGAPGAFTAVQCGNPFAFCTPGWVETDFSFRLTPKQPIVWTLSAGLPELPLDPLGVNGPGIGGQFNAGSIPRAPEDPMIGELKCIEVGDDELPTDRNDLKGEATIEEYNALDSDGETSVDVSGYNAIGIQAIPGANNFDNTLVLGQEYNSCPNVLILDHFFDDAVEPATEDVVETDLTLVPCSEDFNFQFPITTVVQFLVYNEFEQRFSTSRSVTCLTLLSLSDIDTRAGDADDRASIFNVAVEGTLTGQTLIRGVSDSSTTSGHGLLGVAEEFHFNEGIHSAAFNLDQRGTRQQPDIVLLPPAGVP